MDLDSKTMNDCILVLNRKRNNNITLNHNHVDK